MPAGFAPPSSRSRCIASGVSGGVTRFDLPPPPPGLLERSNVEIVEAFLAALAAAGASPKTVKAYRAALMDFVEWLGDRPLRGVTSSDVAAWVYDRLTHGVRRPRGGGDRARRVTMHYYTLFLRGFMEWLGLGVKVPVVKRPRGGRVEALRGEEVERLLSAARDVLDLLIVALLFETGLRAQEAVGLRLRDIDFSRREIRVRNAKYGEERVVLYGPLTEAALREWLRLNPGLGPHDRVLGISYSGLYKRLKSLARRAGLDPGKVRPHVLRHTFATEALRRGVPLPAVQRLLGHHDIKVTQVYLHLLDEDVRRAYETAFTQPPRQATWQQAWQQPPQPPWSPTGWQPPMQPHQAYQAPYPPAPPASQGYPAAQGAPPLQQAAQWQPVQPWQQPPPQPPGQPQAQPPATQAAPPPTPQWSPTTPPAWQQPPIPAPQQTPQPPPAQPPWQPPAQQAPSTRQSNRTNQPKTIQTTTRQNT